MASALSKKLTRNSLASDLAGSKWQALMPSLDNRNRIQQFTSGPKLTALNIAIRRLGPKSLDGPKHWSNVFIKT
ncbi:hypothetical protein V6N13_106300 [Hibiscus sabdariffa]|uniref:Uncharacterized protein n=1 Tax=Hibiscus sabdariffa TaxID=183260 RepID=A0ABR2F0B4_9ROSI